MFLFNVVLMFLLIFLLLLPTAREGNDFTGVCQSVHNWSLGYSVTGHCSTHSRYTSYKNAFLLPSAMKLWKGNVFTPVCQSFCSQGGVSQHALGQTPPWAETPGQTPPVSQHALGQTPPCVSQHALWQTPPRMPLHRTVRILLECILV